MYWTDTILEKVQRANLDGSNVVDVAPGLEFPLGISVRADNVYWTDHSTGKLYRSNLDGSDAVVLQDDLVQPYGVLAEDTKLYWAERNGIRRSNFDGSAVETVIEDADPYYMVIVP